MRNLQYAEQVSRTLLPPSFPLGCGDSGIGQPLVLLHCSGSDRQHWSRCQKAWGEIAALPRRFILPELFGCGSTGRWPGMGHPSLQDYAALVCRVLDDLDERVDLVGHSFGGAVALQIARTMPERIASLTLIEPAAFYILRDQGATEASLLQEFEQLGEKVLQAARTTNGPQRRDGMQCFVDYWNGPGRWNSLPPLLQATMAEMVSVIANDIAAALTETSRLRDYVSLAVPTLLIGGQHSPSPVRHVNAMLAQTLRAARAVSVVGGGHMTPISHATLLASLISDHVAAGRGRSSEMEL